MLPGFPTELINVIQLVPYVLIAITVFSQFMGLKQGCTADLYLDLDLKLAIHFCKIKFAKFNHILHFLLYSAHMINPDYMQEIVRLCRGNRLQ